MIKGKTKKFLKYNLAGSFQFLMDLFLLWFLTEIVGIYYLVSAFISVITSSIIGYSLNRKYVFKKSRRTFLQGYGIFLILTISKIFVIVGLLFLFVDVFRLNYIVSRVLIGLVIVIGMYILHTRFTFKTDFR